MVRFWRSNPRTPDACERSPRRYPPSPHRSVGGLLESGDRLKVDQKLRTMTAKGVLPPPEDENSVYEFRVHEVRNEWALLWGVGSL